MSMIVHNLQKRFCILKIFSFGFFCQFLEPLLLTQPSFEFISGHETVEPAKTRGWVKSHLLKAFGAGQGRICETLGEPVHKIGDQLWLKKCLKIVVISDVKTYSFFPRLTMMF